MKRLFLIIAFFVGLALVSSCGMEPSGGDTKSTSTTTATTSKTDVNKVPDSLESADALPAGIAPLPKEFNEINTAEVSACHVKGKVFNRRTFKCSVTINLATSFACTNKGILDGFAATGFQIKTVLLAAEDDGFLVDQCGESDDGRRMVYFIRADDDGTFSIREIETSLN